MMPVPPGTEPRGATSKTSGVGASATRSNDAGIERSLFTRIIVTSCVLIAIVGFLALGTWQVQRRSWKLDLIAATEQRVHAAPVAVPEPAAWQSVTAQKDAYRHVQVTGTYLPGQSVRVQAVTDLGPGFWLMTPLRQDSGAIVLINRGFVLARQSAAPIDHAACSNDAGDMRTQATVTGLMRMSEARGAFLHDNDPPAQRWYSRDVAAIAKQQRLQQVAPYFVDVDADANQRNRAPSSDCPIGGLTVIDFQNNHLVYAVTWYALALMVAGAFGWNVFVQRRSANTVKHDTD